MKHMKNKWNKIQNKLQNILLFVWNILSRVIVYLAWLFLMLGLILSCRGDR